MFVFFELADFQSSSVFFFFFLVRSYLFFLINIYIIETTRYFLEPLGE